MRFLLLLLIPALLSGEPSFEKEDYKSCEIAEEDLELTSRKLDSEPNLAEATLQAMPSAVVASCVNVITGAFFDNHVGLVVPGAFPLTVEASYSSSDKKWSFRHKPKLLVSTKDEGEKIFGAYSDCGSSFLYEDKIPHNCHKRTFSPHMKLGKETLDQGFTNCGDYEISGQTNLRNSALSFSERENFFVLGQGSGVRRFFKRYKSYGKSKYGGVQFGKFLLDKEIHPTGIHLQYNYYEKELLGIQVKNRKNVQISDIAHRKKFSGPDTLW